MKGQNQSLKKPFLFISDFDGTISDIDFFWQILEHYYPDGKSDDYLLYQQRKLTCFELLSGIFQNIGVSEEELDEEISKIPIDPTFSETANWILQHGGDICILSAGCDYYIQRRLKQEGLHGISIISNHGVYANGGIQMERAEEFPWYSQEAGIDKRVAMEHLKTGYEIVAYAGDGSLDSPAAKLADLRFAKKQLELILKEESLSYYPLTKFQIIRSVLEKKKILK